MHPFDYLSVLISIIIAMGLTHLLTASARLIHLRGRVRVYYPTLVWMATLFLLQVQIWWVAFYRRDIKTWTFFGFLLYLVIPMLVSMLGHLLVPDLKPDTDMEQEYSHNRKWFFGLLASVTVVSLMEDFSRSGTAHFDRNFEIRLAFLALSAAGFCIGKRQAQLAIAALFLATFVGYITFVFSRLG